MLVTDFLVGDINAEKDLDVVFEVAPGFGHSLPKFRINVRRFFDVDDGLRLCHFYPP